MRQLALRAAATAAVLLCGSQSIAAPFPIRTIVIKPAPTLTKGNYGWQPVTTIPLTAEAEGVQLTLTTQCPDNHPRAVSGEYNLSQSQSMFVIRNGSGNLDTPVNSAKWLFKFLFPTEVVASSLSYSIYCADKTEPEPITATMPR